MYKNNTYTPCNIIEFAKNKFNYLMQDLYFPTLIVLPITPEGEEIRLSLYKEDLDMGRYGVYEKNFKYNNGLYLAIIINND